jgi:hypothetical protein
MVMVLFYPRFYVTTLDRTRRTCTFLCHHVGQNTPYLLFYPRFYVTLCDRCCVLLCYQPYLLFYTLCDRCCVLLCYQRIHRSTL